VSHCIAQCKHSHGRTHARAHASTPACAHLHHQEVLDVEPLRLPLAQQEALSHRGAIIMNAIIMNAIILNAPGRGRERRASMRNGTRAHKLRARVRTSVVRGGGLAGG
jgi:hypothetical protein